MDDQGFDRLAKAVAEGVTRRRMLRLVGGGLTAAAAGLFGRSRGGVFAQSTSCSTDAECDLGNACTEDHCIDGVCVSTALNCNDNNRCTDDSCDPLSGCVHFPKDCQTGNLCAIDSGDPFLGCVQTPISCDDGNPCTANDCNSDIGCINTPLPNGTACSTGNACVTGETCQSGTCVGTPVATCKGGQVKGGPCDCDGTCCPVGNDCAGKPGHRRCLAADSQS
jgi:Dictyostelium (slime mold) repeat